MSLSKFFINIDSRFNFSSFPHRMHSPGGSSNLDFVAPVDVWQGFSQVDVSR